MPALQSNGFVKGIGAIALLAALTSQANAQPYDISYGFGPNESAANTLSQRIKKALPEYASKIMVVTNARNFGVIYNANFPTIGQATKVAKEHDLILRQKKVVTRPELGAIVLNDQGKYWKVGTQPKTITKGVRIDNPTIAQPKAAKTQLKGQPNASGDLEKIIKQKVAALKPGERLSVSVAYLGTPGNDQYLKVVGFNDTLQRNSASLMKPYVALADLHLNGRKHQKNLEPMFSRSSNTDTDVVLASLGGPKKVSEVLKQYYGDRFNNIKILDYLGSAGQSYNNTISAHDATQLLHVVYHGKTKPLIDLKGLFYSKKEGVNSRLYAKGKSPANILVGEKTGANRGVNGVMGFIQAPDSKNVQHAYALAIMVNRDVNPSEPASVSQAWMKSKSSFIRGVAEEVHTYMASKYGLKNR